MKRSPIRRVSKKRSSELRKYSKLADEYLRLHSLCEVCDDKSDCVHHKRGRGIHLNNVEYFLAVCNACHDRIHRSPGWAKSQGFMLDRIGKL